METQRKLCLVLHEKGRLLSAQSSQSTLNEVPGLVTSLDHLQELENRMKSVELGFTEGDCDNVDKVIESINELVNERNKLHEKLEIETIKASVLRHKLQFMPSHIEKEIQDSVLAARQLNVDEINTLQKELDAINQDIASLEERCSILDAENGDYLPERDRVRQEHDDIIAQLNQRMSEKANKQITLNETRDKVRETNQRIVDLEEGIVVLKEDLIQERADARIEKKKLKKALYDTTLKTREQKEVNIVKKKEMDEWHEKRMSLDSILNDVKRDMAKLEGTKTRLEKQLKSAQFQAQREKNVNLHLTQECMNTRNTIEQETANFKKFEEECENKLQEIRRDTAIADNIRQSVSEEKAGLQKEVKAASKAKRAKAKEVSKMNYTLQELKITLANSAEEVGGLRGDNQLLETRIIELNETHEAILQTLNKEMYDAREVLSKEKEERIAVQKERDELQKGLDDLKFEQHKFITEVTKYINDGQREHAALIEESKELQKLIQENDIKLRRMTADHVELEADYKNRKSIYEEEVEDLQKSIASMKKDHEVKAAIVDERLPGYKELEEECAKQSEDYANRKREVVNMKNKVLSLDESVKRSVKELQKQKVPQPKLKEEIKQLNAEAMDTMLEQQSEVATIEGDIFQVGGKLKTLREENKKFRQNIVRMEDEITKYKDVDNYEDSLAKLLEELERLKAQLRAAWADDADMEKVFEGRDEELLKCFALLLNQTTERETLVSGVTGRLQTELSALAAFLNNVERRRPKESREGKKSERKKKEPKKEPNSDSKEPLTGR